MSRMLLGWLATGILVVPGGPVVAEVKLSPREIRGPVGLPDPVRLGHGFTCLTIRDQRLRFPNLLGNVTLFHV